MNIVLLSDGEINNGIGVFFKDDARFLHIKKILKLNVKDSFKAGVIDGPRGNALILEFTNDLIRFKFTVNEDMDSLFPIHLMLGFPRPIQLKRILRDVASLGISNLSLVGTELGEKSYLKSDLAKSSNIVNGLLDGCSQAGGTSCPSVGLYSSLFEFFEKNKIAEDDVKLAFDIGKNCVSVSSIGCLPESSILYVAIGSERGWSEAERECFDDNQFVKCSMGSRVLRTETATVSAISVLLSNLGFWL